MKSKYSGLKGSITHLLPVPFCGGLFLLGFPLPRDVFQWLLHWTSRVQSPLVLKQISVFVNQWYLCVGPLFSPSSPLFLRVSWRVLRLQAFCLSVYLSVVLHPQFILSKFSAVGLLAGPQGRRGCCVGGICGQHRQSCQPRCSCPAVPGSLILSCAVQANCDQPNT